MEIADKLIDAVICGKILLQKSAWEISFICNFCEKNLSTLPELLRHALNEHVENATADKLEKLCGAETQQEIDVESNVCNQLLQEIIDQHEQEEMDEEILQYFMNKTRKNNIETATETEMDVFFEGADFDGDDNIDDIDDGDDGDAGGHGKQSNAKFEFLDIDDAKTDSAELQPTAVLPKRLCKISTMLQCETCNAKFQYNKQLRKHKAKEHGENPFICNECGKIFSERRCLSDHELRHKGIKPHACTMCEKTFTTHIERVMHIRRHTGERPYKCSVCDKDFISSGALSTHTRIHTNERPHLCPTCGMKFSSTSGLKKHITTHSSERPYNCSHCKANFKDRNGLRQHMLIHSDIKKYACQFCEKTFAQQAGVYSHIKSSHKNEHKIANK